MNPHCGPNGFSPPAPAHMCNPPTVTHTVPEPDVIGLLFIAGLVAYVAKKIKR
jgi:hypothetical protein